MSSQWTELMRREWNERARKDAFHYIASWKTDWDVKSFLGSGEEDYLKLVAPALERCAISAQGGSMLELGCGAGRMTGSFAQRRARVYAFDISTEMLGKARKIHDGAQNIVWMVSNGEDLSCVATGTMDFVFSYLVLQHLPNETLVERYISEMFRVLRPGGTALFEYHGGFARTMNWRGQMAWKAVDALWAVGLPSWSRGLAKMFGGDPEIAGKTWRGASVTAEKIAGYVRTAGGNVREMTGQGTPMAWCLAVKADEADGPQC